MSGWTAEKGCSEAKAPCPCRKRPSERCGPQTGGSPLCPRTTRTLARMEGGGTVGVGGEGDSLGPSLPQRPGGGRPEPRGPPARKAGNVPCLEKGTERCSTCVPRVGGWSGQVWDGMSGVLDGVRQGHRACGVPRDPGGPWALEGSPFLTPRRRLQLPRVIRGYFWQLRGLEGGGQPWEPPLPSSPPLTPLPSGPPPGRS